MTDEKNGTPPANGEAKSIVFRDAAPVAMSLWDDEQELQRIAFPHLNFQPDIQYLMAYGKAIQANPLTGDIYAYRTKETDKTASALIIVLSVHLWRERASEQPAYLSHFRQVVYKNDEFSKYITMDGVTITHKPATMADKDKRGGIVGAYCVGKKMSKSGTVETFFHWVNFGAYSKSNKFWTRDPEGMIEKCAEVGWFRLAFPGVFKKAYSEAEMDDGKDGPVFETEAITAPAQPPALDNQMLNIEDLRLLVEEKLKMLYDNADSIEAAIMNATKTDSFPGYASLKEINLPFTLHVIEMQLDKELKQNAIT